MSSKKHYILFYLLVYLLFFSGFNTLSGKEKKISLTLPDLQKYFDIRQDNLKLSWDEFRKILEQLGNKISAEYSLSDGIVTLKRDQFALLLKKMPILTSKNIKSPYDYLISNCKYIGNSTGKNSKFNLNASIYIFKSDKYVSVPVLSSKAAISEILVDEKPGLITIRGGWYYINLYNKGYHNIKVKFSIENNKQSVSLPVIRSSITSLDFSVPLPGYEFSCHSFINPEVIQSEKKSIFSAYFRSSNNIYLNWNLKRDKIKKKPVVFYSRSNSLISVASDIIKVNTSIDLEIIQSSLNKVSLLIPEDYKVINTVGNSINNWAVRKTDIGLVLEVNFAIDITRTQKLNIYFEKIVEANTLGFSFSGIKILDSKRETGFLGIVAENEVEVEIAKNKDLEKIVFHKIPKTILSMTTKPILNTFKYSKHPYKLGVSIYKHKKIEGLSTLIESAKAEVLFLENGKVLHKVEYFVRNSYKQFLELDLPEGSTIWSVLVNNKREKASSNKKGKILIPLLRSSGNGDQLKAFKVVLIYARPSKAFSLKGNREILLPKTDIFLNKIRMDVYVPNGYDFSMSKMEWKEFKKVIMPRPPIKKIITSEEKFDKSLPKGRDLSKKVTRSPGIRRNKQVKPKEKFNIDGVNIADPNTPESIYDEAEGGVEGDNIGDDLDIGVLGSGKKQESKKLTKAGEYKPLTGPVGLNSINIKLPISGQKFSFTKSIINKSEIYPLKFSFSNQRFFRTLYFILGFLLVVFIFLFLIYRIKKRKRG